MKMCVDRIEEGRAVLLPESGEGFSCPLPLLPRVKEGDWLDITFRADPETTRARREEAERLLRELLE
jgi:hypothetical protein